MICYVRKSTIEYDIRLHKYINACLKTSTPYKAITWDRMNNCKNVFENELQYKKLSPYSDKKRLFLNYIGWMIFVYKTILSNFKSIKVIHACNLDIFLLVLPLKLFHKKIIFDIYDSINPKIEHKLVKFADILILPNQKRLEQIGFHSSDDLKNLLVIENVPDIRFNNPDNPTFSEISDKKIRLSYVGVFEKEIRGIENLLKFVALHDYVFLDIAGVGSNMEEKVVEYQKKCERIHYYGQVSYDKALNIMSNSDFIVALYYQLNSLHKYASPNKYYESLCLGRPIITSKNTLVGSNVEKNNTGYTIEDTYQALENLFAEYDSKGFKEQYKEKSNNCNRLWQSLYSDYFQKILCEKYISIAKE